MDYDDDYRLLLNSIRFGGSSRKVKITVDAKNANNSDTDLGVKK